MKLAVDVRSIARRLPAEERFELAKQMRGAAISIAATIAEGKGRTTRAECARFIAIARGSARELDTYFELVQRLGCVTAPELRYARQLLDEIERMLTALLRRLNPLRPPPSAL